MSLFQAFSGGVMIGAAALLLYAASGRIAGISGIGYGLLWQKGDRGWRALFVAGLIGGGWLALLAGSRLSAPAAWSTAQAGLTLVGGALVGFGTRLGDGCTSGHGVCGLPRLSRRSLAAVLTFMGAGMLTATLLRPLFI